MTFQEALALAQEREENLAYRKRIDRIKNTILGSLAGAGVGAIAGAVKDKSDSNVVDRVMNRSPKSGKVIGATAGAALGGLGAYGASRIKEKFGSKSAGAKEYLNKSAQFATIGRLIGEGGALAGKGLGLLLAGTGRAIGSAGKFSAKKLGRFLNLIGGGNEATMKDYNTLKSWVKDQIAVAKGAGNSAEVKRFSDLSDEIFESFIKGNGKEYTIALPGGDKTFTATRDVSDELGKIIAARSMAGAGLAGGGYYAHKKYKEKTRPWYKFTKD